MSLLGFGMGTMMVNFHNMCDIILLLKRPFKYACEEFKSKRAWVFHVPDV